MNEKNEKSEKNEKRFVARFDHDRLEVTPVLREALKLGVRIANSLPRGYADTADQLRRALQGAYLNTCEAAARRGQDRVARYRAARAEASEAGGAAQGILCLELAPERDVERLLELLGRATAMLFGLLRANGAVNG